MPLLARLGTIAGLTLLVSAPAFAQTGPPPPLLQIGREEVRPGKGAAHTMNESAWGAAFVKAGSPVTWLGMRAIAGPSEAWFLTGWASWPQTARSPTRH